MRAKLSEIRHGLRLELEPMRAVDAVDVWSALPRRADATTLVYAGAARRSAAGPNRRDRHDPLGARAIMVDSAHDAESDVENDAKPVVRSSREPVTMVLVEGPVEPSDTNAIGAAVAADRSPLDVELRAVAAMKIVNDRAVFVESRDRDVPLTFVAENFRHYLAALRRQPLATFAAPELSLVDRVLSMTGELMVRPIETEVYSTAIDIGIGNNAMGPAKPAVTSLIYDIYGNAWYGE
jgi:hypothetical protein